MKKASKTSKSRAFAFSRRCVKTSRFTAGAVTAKGSLTLTLSPDGGDGNYFVVTITQRS